MFKRIKTAAGSVSSKVCEKLTDAVETVAESISTKVCDKLAVSMVENGLSLIEFNCKLQNLKANSERLSSIASDIETQIKNEELVLGKKKRKREVEEWLKMVQETKRHILTLETEIQERVFIKSLISGNRVAKLNERVQGLIEQSRHFGGLLLLDDCENRGEPLLTSKLCGETFERILGRIWECLMDNKIPIIGICGMAGVGKTTLAMHIHNLVLERTQNRVYWIKVSQEFSIQKLQDDIAAAIGINALSHNNSEEKRASELNQALVKRKGFVLILDNVCEDINLERVGFPNRVDGCQLMITTRSLKLCRRIGCQEKFEVKTLDEDEAWNMFKETFGEETTLSPQVEEIAKSMVKNQGGLPQGIINLAREMRGETEIREWRNASTELEEVLTREGDNAEEEKFVVLSDSSNVHDPN